MTTVADPVTAADVSGIVWASTDDPPPSRHGPWAQFPITWFLPLPDGSIRGADGCRMFASEPGSWRIEAGTLTTGPIPFSEDTCGGRVPYQPVRRRANHPRTDCRRASRPLDSAHNHPLRGLDETNRVSDERCGRPMDRRRPEHVRVPLRRGLALHRRHDVRRQLHPCRPQPRRQLGECTGNFTILSHPISRGATAHLSRWTGRLLISGDAGVFAPSCQRHKPLRLGFHPATEPGLKVGCRCSTGLGRRCARSISRPHLTSLTAMLQDVAASRHVGNRALGRPRAIEGRTKIPGPSDIEGSQHCLLTSRYRRPEAVGGVRDRAGGLGR